MIILYVLGAVILLLSVVLALPLKVELGFLGDFWVRVKFINFTLYPKKEKPKSNNTPRINDAKKSKQKDKNLFQRLVEKRGFKGAVSELFGFFKAVITPLKRFLKAIKFRKIDVNLVVGGGDACETAVNYGTVCSVVYPLLSLFQNIANVKYKNIDVRSDFEGGKSDFDFNLELKIPIFILLIFGFKIFKSYKNFCVRNDLQ